MDQSDAQSNHHKLTATIDEAESHSVDANPRLHQQSSRGALGGQKTLDDSPPPRASSPTTGTTTTPASSIGTGTPSSPSGHHHSLDRSNGPPSFPNEPSTYDVRTPHMSERRSSGHSEWGDELTSGYRPQDQSNTARTDATSGPQVSFSPSTPIRHSTSQSLAAIKFLVSNNVAGSIIGRSGQTISDLQNESSTRIKLSQSGDYYPGTQERVCLVQGQPDNVKKAASLLLTRLYTLQQQHEGRSMARESTQPVVDLHGGTVVPTGSCTSRMGESLDESHPSEPPSATFAVRILIPAQCCGMIIGKSGSNIKELVDASGVISMRLASKEGTDPSGEHVTAALVMATSERAVTIVGLSLNSCIKCVFAILDSMEEHPEICRYTNMTTSYSRVVNGGPTYGAQLLPALSAGRSPTTSTVYHSTGSEPAHLVRPTVGSWDSHARTQHVPSNKLDAQRKGGTFEVPLAPFQITGPARHSSGFAPHPTSPLELPRESIQYSPVFGTPPPMPFAPSSATFPQNQSVRTSPMYLPFSQGTVDSSSQGTAGRVHTSLSAPDLLAMQFQESLRLSPDPQRMAGFRPVPAHYAPPLHAPSTAAGPQNAFVAQVAIPDNLIGSILGRAGRTLTEIQQLSNTRIRISQKGEFLPGTRNRIVTIRGPSAQSVSSAQYLMNQRMVLPPTAVAPDAGLSTQQPMEGGTPHGPANYRRTFFPDYRAPTAAPTTGESTDAASTSHQPPL